MADHLTDDDLTELRRLVQNAKPPPWELTVTERSWEDVAGSGEWYAQIEWALHPLGSDPDTEWVLAGMDDRGEFDQVRADAKLATAVVNALPGLLAEVERLRAAALFVPGDFVAHSGDTLRWKIECDTLTDRDWEALALAAVEVLPPFGGVEGVPTGGDPFARALAEHSTPGGPLLIADDVCTTGASLDEHRAGRDAIGVVAFARGPVPSWVIPLFALRAAAGSPPPTPAPTREQVREGAAGRWVVDDGPTVWWEFGAHEAMEPEEALRNHVDNQQFNAAYDALVALIAQPDREPEPTATEAVAAFNHIAKTVGTPNTNPEVPL